jgi:hypothetical protein
MRRDGRRTKGYRKPLTGKKNWHAVPFHGYGLHTFCIMPYDQDQTPMMSVVLGPCKYTYLHRKIQEKMVKAGATEVGETAYNKLAVV